MMVSLEHNFLIVTANLVKGLDQEKKKTLKPMCFPYGVLILMERLLLFGNVG